jgi:DNA-binding transcriptional regulator YiaG
VSTIRHLATTKSTVPRQQPESTLGSHVRRLRIRRGFNTQDALAAAVGVNVDTVGRWERDETAPSGDVVDVLIAAIRPERPVERMLREASRDRRSKGTIFQITKSGQTAQESRLPHDPLEKQFVEALINAISCGYVKDGDLVAVAKMLARFFDEDHST